MIVRGTVTHLIFTTHSPPEIDHAPKKKKTHIVFQHTPGTCGIENKRMKDKPSFFSVALFTVALVKFSSNYDYCSIRRKREAEIRQRLCLSNVCSCCGKTGWMKRSPDPTPHQQYLPIRRWEDQVYLKASMLSYISKPDISSWSL